MAIKAELWIVRSSEPSRFNCLFLMRSTDFRFGTPDYLPVVKTKRTKESIVADNGHKMFVCLTPEGKRYGVFSDWSARSL